jgi:hypothetical protein
MCLQIKCVERIIMNFIQAMRDLLMILSCLLVALQFTKAQSVVISEEGNASPASSAILDVQSTDQGILIPRMTRAQRDNIASPSNGLLIYQTDNSPGFYYRDGTAWVSLKGSGGITSETDPQVGTISNNHLARWDGSKLVTSSVEENTTTDEEKVIFFNNAFVSSTGTLSTVDNIKVYQVGDDINERDGDKARIEVADGEYAYMFLSGQNDNPIVRLGATYDTFEPNTYGVNRGSVYVFKGDRNAPEAGIEVDNLGRGVVFGDVKNFVEPHPLDASKEIVYASLEGPEAAMYTRGTGTLIDGKATIEVPEHFRLMAVENSMTVLITPLSIKSKGLAVTDKSLERGLVVEELMEGAGSYDFDWEIRCIRKGFEDYQVVRPKKSAAH